MRHVVPYLLLIPALLLVACGGSNSTSSELMTAENLFAQMCGSTPGDLRGLSIGASVDAVLKVETTEPLVREDDTYLVYTFPLDDNSLYSVTYSLDEVGLYEIQIEADLTDKTLTGELFDEIKQVFEARYGIPFKAKSGQASWILEHEQYQEIEVLLVDESEDYDTGKLAVGFYAFQQ